MDEGEGSRIVVDEGERVEVKTDDVIKNEDVVTSEKELKEDDEELKEDDKAGVARENSVEGMVEVSLKEEDIAVLSEMDRNEEEGVISTDDETMEESTIVVEIWP